MKGNCFVWVVVMDFMIKQVRSEIGEGSKVNCFVWMAVSGTIPTAMALAARRVAYGEGRCLMCGIAVESADHLLAACISAKAVWWLVCIWVNTPVSIRSDTLIQLLDHVQNLAKPTKEKNVIYAGGFGFAETARFLTGGLARIQKCWKKLKNARLHG